MRILKPLKKLQKSSPKKVKKSIFQFSHEFFAIFFYGINISIKFCVFDTHIKTLQNKYCLLIVAFFTNFEAKIAWSGSKEIKVSNIIVS